MEPIAASILVGEDVGNVSIAARRVGIIVDLQRAHAMESEAPVPVEAYVPGAANGRNFMAKLCRVGDGPWTIEIVHVEGLAPLNGSGGSWPTREEAAQAAEQLVAALAH